MFPSLVSALVAVAIQLPAADVTYEWASLDGTVRTAWSADQVTITVKGTRSRAREVAADVRSDFGTLAEPEFRVKRGRVIVTIRR
jgi:hypothetical protein